MMALDEVLAGSVQPISVEAGDLAVKLSRSIAEQRRSRGRSRWIVAGVLAGSLVVGGGALSAAAQAGWVKLPWVGGADKNTNYSVSLPNGHVYSCPAAFHVQGDYTVSGSYADIQKAIKEAKAYLRKTELQSLKPDLRAADPASPDDPANPSGGSITDPSGLTPEQRQVRQIRQAWIFSVTANVDDHLRKEGLPDVAFGIVLGRCEQVSP